MAKFTFTPETKTVHHHEVPEFIATYDFNRATGDINLRNLTQLSKVQSGDIAAAWAKVMREMGEEFMRQGLHK